MAILSGAKAYEDFMSFMIHKFQLCCKAAKIGFYCLNLLNMTRLLLDLGIFASTDNPIYTKKSFKDNIIAHQKTIIESFRCKSEDYDEELTKLRDKLRGKYTDRRM